MVDLTIPLFFFFFEWYFQCPAQANTSTIYIIVAHQS